MPVIGSNFVATYGDVTSRTRSILNDDAAQIWTDTVLTNHVRNAYTWVYNEIAKMVDVSFVKVTGPGGDLAYLPTVAGQEQDQPPRFEAGSNHPSHATSNSIQLTGRRFFSRRIGHHDHMHYRPR